MTKKESPKHSPLPWEVVEYPIHPLNMREGVTYEPIDWNIAIVHTPVHSGPVGSFTTISGISGSSGTTTENDRANAQLIVRAVNSHEVAVEIIHMLREESTVWDSASGELARVHLRELIQKFQEIQHEQD